MIPDDVLESVRRRHDCGDYYGDDRVPAVIDELRELRARIEAATSDDGVVRALEEYGEWISDFNMREMRAAIEAALGKASP